MSSSTSPSRPVRRWLLRGLVLLVVIGLGIAALATRTRVLHRLARDHFTRELARHGYTLQTGPMRGGLFDPLELSDVRVDSPVGLRLRVERLHARLAWDRILTRKGGGWVRELVLDGVRLREGERPSDEPPAWTAWDPRPWLPQRWFVHDLDARVRLPDGSLLSATGGSALASERGPGRLFFSRIRVDGGAKSFRVEGLSGTTAWRDGTLHLAGLKFGSGFELDEFSIDLAAMRRKRLEMVLNARWQQGAVRADLAISGRGSSWFLDAAASAWNLDIARAIPKKGARSNASGWLREGKLSFRGSTATPARGDWGIRVVADGFALGARRFDTLALGATANEGAVQLYEFNLRQGPNELSMRGEGQIPSDFTKTELLRGSAWVDARFEDVALFATLLPRRFHHLVGRGTLRGQIAAAPGSLRGGLIATAAPLGIRGVTLDRAELALDLNGQDIEVRKALLQRGADTAELSGGFSLAESRRYRGELKLSVREASDYEKLHPVEGFAGLRGSIQGNWAGDGTRERHSGAFHVSTTELRFPLARGGTTLPLAGEFEGTYSPESLYFRRFELRQGKTNLQSAVTVTPRSFGMQGFSLGRGAVPLLEGNLWLPLDIRSVWGEEGFRRFLDPTGRVYADLHGKGVDIAELLRLTGREHPVRGTCSLAITASGTPSDLTAKGRVDATGLSWQIDGREFPASTMNLTFDADEALLSFAGNLTNSAARNLQLTGTLPTRLRAAIEEGLPIIRSDAPLDLRLEIADANAAHWAALTGIPLIESGRVRGSLRVSGSSGTPVWSGALALQGGKIGAPVLTDPLTRLSGNLVFRDTTAELQNCSGSLGTAAARLSGSIGLDNPLRPSLSIHLESGSARFTPPTPGMPLTARYDVWIAGPAETARLAGRIVTTGGELRHGIRVAAPPPPGEPAEALLPAISLDPLPPGWELDVSLENEGVQGPAEASIHSALLLRGTVASPYLLGHLDLGGWPVVLEDPTGATPAARGTIETARLAFAESNPWTPTLGATLRFPETDGAPATTLRFEATGSTLGELTPATPTPPPLASEPPPPEPAGPPAPRPALWKLSQPTKPIR